ncbi:oxidoreductase [Parapedobacter pyrenivorans]|uniref:Oxidoreductase n=1 Tax=Parapedobacter pyrenivorans TaxID=1305674 RepID=A0A917HIK7_9SPHI|nr:Gfo/Idh/MocA family oxidoreductase [Parapedobacter pyrenivorans]GGG79799.1 oxidoreductase [Parapedobacter pyrenivorans]
MNTDNLSSSRRTFLKNSAALAGATLLGTHSVRANGHLSGSDTLKIALIGCGSRGAGAAVNALRADKNVQLVAMADAFADQLATTHSTLLKITDIKDAVRVPESHMFVGFDGYKEAIALADVVILATPPAFRPLHFDAVVAAGKHTFMEKPLASDAQGIRQVLAAGEAARQKNLKVSVGLQNRYDPAFIELKERLQGGQIGEIVSATDYYLIGPVRHVDRLPGQTEMEYQMRNWRYFNWLWAGSPAALQIHNTDIVNWVKGGYPVRAQGMGGRSGSYAPGYGDIFDSFFIEYEYADGTKLNSQIRSIAGTWNRGGATFIGTEGRADAAAKTISDLQGNGQWRSESRANSYQLQHDQFFAAIRDNTPMNDTEWAAMSTMTTILGRMAAHSGKLVEWEDALNSELSILPETFAWDAAPPTLPDNEGRYPIPIPGQALVL